MVVEVSDVKGIFSYFDTMSRDGEFAGSLEAHVAGLVLNIEIHTVRPMMSRSFW